VRADDAREVASVSEERVGSAGPLVTVGIPSYNNAAHVGDALASALAQTYVRLQVLVIDDASTDGTFEVVSAVSDPRLRVLANERNLGAVGNWNRVVAEARGDYVKVLHGDDLLAPDAVSLQVEALEAHPEAVLATSRRRIVNETGTRVATRGPSWPQGVRPGREALAEVARKGANLIGEPSAVLVRAKVLREVGGFDAAAGYVVDLELWARLLLLGDLAFEPRALASYRVRPGQLSEAMAQTQAQDMARLLERLASHPALGITAEDVRRGTRAAKRQARLRRMLYAAGATPLVRARRNS
jgi:glycosyltransferase involved in cell wall biosynthesis